MLFELRIENLLLIEQAELRLGPGLNAITGETGAGKTVLAHSLDLLMGGRARPQIVRPGAMEAYVEGVFEMPDGLFDDPELADLAERLPADTDELVLSRRVSAGGRTAAYVQGRSANVGDLRLLGSRLLAFFGQHEHRRLTLGSAQLDVLDGFIGEQQLELRARYRAAHTEVRGIERELAELRDREGARERDLDLMRFELEEILAVAPDAEERDELAAERDRLRHAEALRTAAGGARDALSPADGDAGAVAALAVAEGALGAIQGVDANLDGLGERVAAATLELGDLVSELRSYLEGIDAEPGRLEQVEERLAAMERLERKHGGTLAAVLAHGAHCRTEIERLENAEGLAGELGHVEGVGADRRLGRRQADHLGPGAVQVDRHRLDPGAALGPELDEEGGQGRLGAPRPGPDDPPGVVADHAQQVAVALAVGDLVDADPPQPIQGVRGVPEGLVDDPLDHPSDRRPVDAHQPGDDRLGRVAGEDGAGVLEGSGEARARPGPGHLLADDTAGRTVDPAHLGPDQAGGAKGIQVAPAPGRAVVDRACPMPTPRAAHRPSLGAGDVHHDPLVGAFDQLDPDHPLAAQPEQALE